jgi:hypothetical protein
MNLRSENGWTIDLQPHIELQPHMMMTLLWWLMRRPTRHITVTGRQHNFDPLWYPQLISMAEESLDSMGFDLETIAICATQIFSEKLSLPAEEASFYTPSDTWCYWFMRQKMGLSMRK